MTQIQLPHPNDLMLPTLRAVVELGGSAPYGEIDDKATVIAGITEEQMSVVFGADATATGPKILHRIAWARTMLKRIGALEGAGHGRWAVTEYGRDLAAKSDEEAQVQISKDLALAYATIEPSDEELAGYRERAERNDPVSMSVRELIGKWGASRRRSGVIERVSSALRAHQLATDPDFSVGGLDSVVRLVALEEDEQVEPSVESGETGPKPDRGTISLRVGNIPSATRGVSSVNPQQDLLTAQSEMQANDYSQLAVMTSEHNLVGAISWESIAKAILVHHEAPLIDCIDPYPKVVRLEQPLLNVVPDISDAGFVFVRDGHNKITGIITVADLADQFASLTKPFLLIGEIERLLRMAIDRCYSTEDLYESLDPDDEREVEGASSLTLGEIQRLLENPAGFARLTWIAERKVFIKHLDEVRQIRNEIMHFSPDPLTDTDTTRLGSFANWIRQLESQVASS